MLSTHECWKQQQLESAVSLSISAQYCSSLQFGIDDRSRPHFLASSSVSGGFLSVFQVKPVESSQKRAPSTLSLGTASSNALISLAESLISTDWTLERRFFSLVVPDVAELGPKPAPAELAWRSWIRQSFPLGRTSFGSRHS